MVRHGAGGKTDVPAARPLADLFEAFLQLGGGGWSGFQLITSQQRLLVRLDKEAGWVIRSSVFRSNQQFLWSKDRFYREKDLIDSLTVDLFKDRRDRFDHGRSILKIEKIERAKIERLKSNRFAHSRSFLKIDGIDSITVDLFKRSTRAIRSRSIYFKDRKIEV